MKKCCHCKDVLLESCFFAHHGTADGLQTVCKKCTKLINRHRNAHIRAGYVKTAQRQIPDKRMCIRCCLIQDNSNFIRCSRSKDGLNPWCKACRVEYNREWRHRNLEKRRKYEHKNYSRRKANGGLRKSRLAKYGLTPEKFDLLFSSQGRVCAICKSSTTGNKREWHIDHDHSCCPPEHACDKCRRGILCHHCNVAVGSLRDDPVILRRAIDYLFDPPAKRLLAGEPNTLFTSNQ